MRIAKAIVLMFALAACAKTSAPPSGGSESHFLDACESSSECGALSCIGEVCTLACESDAPCLELAGDASCEPVGEAMHACVVVGDASVNETPPDQDAAVESDAVLLGTSEVLGQQVEVAFVEGKLGDEQLWLRGEGGALSKVSVWPADEAWQDSPCDDPASFGGYLTGQGRFSQLMFDGTGRYLVFAESLGCYFTGPQRIVVHELATGRSHSLGTFEDMVQVSAGPRSLVAGYLDDDSYYALNAIDPVALTMTPIDVPSGNALISGSVELIALGADEEVLMAVGHPVMRLNDAGVALFDPIDSLGPDLQLGDLSASPNKETLCIGTRSVKDGPDIEAGKAVFIQGEHASVYDISQLGFTCAFTASGRYAMVGNAPFDLLGEDIEPLPAVSAMEHVAGAYRELFFGTNEESGVVRYEPLTDTSNVLIAGSDLEDLCDGEQREFPSTQLFMSPRGARIAIVKHHCGSADLDQSVSLALDLETGGYTLIEAAGDLSYNAFDVVWPDADTAYLFSALTGQEQPTFYEIGPGSTVTTQTLAALTGILHSPAVPQR